MSRYADGAPSHHYVLRFKATAQFSWCSAIGARISERRKCLEVNLARATWSAAELCIYFGRIGA
ncbi:hypothetical protein [Bradyrhizobium symbiodeficiens]|uniref:hypothetical protein n=1 Tax=Bradyrhizobium symbiodeficiens TaxID=1404367 RepID=UPI0011E4D3AF|nr:hypothetical protein [Bradyrhizobium symbiodeficiens]